MKISVVIPAYNEEKYLPATLMSVGKLKRKADEVVVVDGGSTDRTAAVARKYGAHVVTIPHRTIGFTRQRGLETARGDVVAFTDADTIVPPDWLAKIEETLSKPGVVGTYGIYKVPNGRLLYRLSVNVGNPITFLLGNLVGIYIVGGQNIAFWKQKALDAGGFPVNFRSMEDYEIMNRLAKVGKVIYRRDNPVVASSRRGEEGPGLFVRIGWGFLRYFLTGRADTFTFPNVR